MRRKEEVEMKRDCRVRDLYTQSVQFNGSSGFSKPLPNRIDMGKALAGCELCGLVQASFSGLVMGWFGQAQQANLTFVCKTSWQQAALNGGLQVLVANESGGMIPARS